MPFAAAVPFSTLETNRFAVSPCVTATESHGPLMPLVIVSLTCPSLLSTIRHPAWDVDACPFVDGTLPTTTQPPGSTSSAVVRPTPPGQGPGSVLALMSAKRDRIPFGLTWTIVVPLPCSLRLLLKLLISTLPACRSPVLCWIMKMPYGLTSPLVGIVEWSVVSVWKWLRYGTFAADAAGAIARPRPAMTPVAAAVTAAMRCRAGMHAPFGG